VHEVPSLRNILSPSVTSCPRSDQVSLVFVPMVIIIIIMFILLVVKRFFLYVNYFVV
jgi:hypothetical protein